MIVLRILAFLAGAGVVVVTLSSAVRTFVLPRSAPDAISRYVFLGVRFFFGFPLKKTTTYLARDRILAWYAPIGLLMLVPAWYLLILVGYAGMFWGDGARNLYAAFHYSGSSLFTLGFDAVEGWGWSLLAFSEAMIGLVLVALLIAYLPTIYAAFSRRETAVTLLEVRAGTPPSAEQMLLRYHRIHGFDRLTDEWLRWETWFADIQESHTSLAALVFLRSPQPQHSWVTAAGAVLDTAAISLAALDKPTDPQAALCIRGGYLALRAIADYFNIVYNPNPRPDDPIAVRREEFEALLDRLAAENARLKPDRDQAWRDFSGWRVNYDAVLLALAGLTSAPSAPWSSDRAKNSPIPPAFAARIDAHQRKASLE
jgi:hypothetical protein